MGQDQSKGDAQQQNNSPLLNLDEVPPYTSFSVPTTASSQAEQQESHPAPTSGNHSRKNHDAGELEGIVSVTPLENTITDMFGNVLPDTLDSQQEEESTMEQLKNLPHIYPLLKNKIESSSSIFSSRAPTALPGVSFIAAAVANTGVASSSGSNYELDPHLDQIDERPLIDMCAEFQTYAMQQSRGIAVRQQAVQNRLQITESESGLLVADLNAKNEQLKKLNAALRDAERLNRSVVQSQQGVMVLLARLEELENLLPHSVKSNINTPLFQHSNAVKE